ncbi:hypothetical protein FOA52_002350, partial [Chlamydomonas sp. UWO 241]
VGDVPHRTLGAFSTANIVSALLVVGRAAYRRAMEMQTEISELQSVDACCRLPFLRHTPLKELFKLSRHLRRMTCLRGDAVITQGAENSSIFFLLEGDVEVVVDVPRTSDHAQIVGHLTALRSAPRRVSGVIRTPRQLTPEAAAGVSPFHTVHTSVAAHTSVEMQRVVLGRRAAGAVLGDDSLREKICLVGIVCASARCVVLTTSAQRFSASLDALTLRLFGKLNEQHEGTEELRLFWKLKEQHGRAEEIGRAITDAGVASTLAERLRSETLMQAYEGNAKGMPKTLSRTRAKDGSVWLSPDPGGSFFQAVGSIATGEHAELIAAAEAKAAREAEHLRQIEAAGGGVRAGGGGAGAPIEPGQQPSTRGQRGLRDATSTHNKRSGRALGVTSAMFKHVPASASLAAFVEVVKGVEAGRSKDAVWERNRREQAGDELSRLDSRISTKLDLSDIIPISASGRTAYTDLVEAACLSVVRLAPMPGQLPVSGDDLSTVLDDAIGAWSSMCHDAGLQLIRWSSHEYYLLGGLAANPGSPQRPTVRVVADTLLEMQQAFFTTMARSDVPAFSFCASVVVGAVFASYNCGRFLSGVAGHAFEAACVLCSQVKEASPLGAILVSDAVMQSIGRTHVLEFGGAGYLLHGRVVLPCGATFESIIGKGIIDRDPKFPGNATAGDTWRTGGGGGRSGGAAATAGASGAWGSDRLGFASHFCDSGSGGVTLDDGYGLAVAPHAAVHAQRFSNATATPGAGGGSSDGSPGSPTSQASTHSKGHALRGGSLGPKVPSAVASGTAAATASKGAHRHSPLSIPGWSAAGSHGLSPGTIHPHLQPGPYNATFNPKSVVSRAGSHGLSPKGAAAAAAGSPPHSPQLQQQLLQLQQLHRRGTPGSPAGPASPLAWSASQSGGGGPPMSPTRAARVTTLEPRLCLTSVSARRVTQGMRSSSNYRSQLRGEIGALRATCSTGGTIGSNTRNTRSACNSPGQRPQGVVLPDTAAALRLGLGSPSAASTAASTAAASGIAAASSPAIATGTSRSSTANALLGAAAAAAALPFARGESPLRRSFNSRPVSRGGGGDSGGSGGGSRPGSAESVSAPQLVATNFGRVPSPGAGSLVSPHDSRPGSPGIVGGNGVIGTDGLHRRRQRAVDKVSGLTAAAIHNQAVSTWKDLGSARAAAEYVEALAPGVVNISFSTAGLPGLPSAMSRLTYLESVAASFNALGSLGGPSPQLCILSTHLKVLNLSHSGVTDLPADFGARFPLLLELNVSSNALSCLPNSLATHCHKLTALSLERNVLSSLPRSLSRLDALQQLHAGHNAIHGLPDRIFEGCVSLQVLDLSSNTLASLPSSLCALPSLTSLSASFNRLEALPPGLLDSATGLIRLELAGNRLCYCPQVTGLAQADLDRLNARCNNSTGTAEEAAAVNDVNEGEAHATAVVAAAATGAASSSSSSAVTGSGDGPSVAARYAESAALPCGAVVRLPRLSTLVLSSNSLLAVPPWLPPSLQHLDLARNGLSELSDWLPDRCRHLEHLDVHACKLVSVSRGFAALRDLKSVCLQDNPVTDHVEGARGGARGGSAAWLFDHLSQLRHQARVTSVLNSGRANGKTG